MGRTSVQLLEWYIAAGADEAIGEVPRDCFAAPPRQTNPGPKARSRRPPGAVVSLGAAAALSAAEIAAACTSIEELVVAIKAFEGCALKETATNTCVYDGNPSADLVFIGEAPGAEEDRRGLPFVGRAGRLLDRMLAAIGRGRDSAYISNVLFWRPPGNRSPTPDEIEACLPFVDRQISLIAPKVLVLVGGISAKAVLGRSEGITRQRGVWREYSPRDSSLTVPTTAIFHPAYLLRTPLKKREAWRDLLAIKKRLGAD